MKSGSKYSLNEYITTSFIEGQDKDDHYNLEGDLEILGIVQCAKSVHCCKFHPNGELFAVGLSDGLIQIYRKESLDVIYSLIDNDIRVARLPVTSIRFFNKPNDTNQDHYQILVASYVTGYIKFWHYPSKSCIYTLFDDITQPLTMDFNMTFETLAVAGYNDEIKIYDVATKKLINTLERSSSTQVNGHSSRIYCVKYNGSDRNQLVSGGWDDTLQVWDHRCPDSQAFLYGPHICGETLDIDADHNHLLCGSWRKNNTLQIFDMRNMGLIRDVFKRKCPMMIYGAQWLGKGYIFTCGSEKNSAVIYDRGTLKPMGKLSELKNAVTSIDNDGIGELPNLLVASESTLYILKKKKVLREVVDKAGRKLQVVQE